MDELLSEEFTLEFYKMLQDEFERFVADVGERIVEKVRQNSKTKVSGTLFVGQQPLTKKETMLWTINEEFLPMIWEAVTNDYGFAPVEDTIAPLDFNVEETEAFGKQAWFALYDKYSGVKTPTFTQFCFGLRDYLKPYGIEAACKVLPKKGVTEIKFKTVK